MMNRVNRTTANNRPTGNNNRPRIENALQLENVVLNKSLRLFFVSSLSHFSFDRHFLRHLSRKMSFHLFTNDKCDYGKASGSGDTSLDVDIRPIADEHNNPIGVRIKIVMVEDFEEDRLKHVFYGVLTNTGWDQEGLTAVTKASWFCLPLLLLKANHQITGSVVNFLQRQFDCHIEAFHISCFELSWLSAMWAGFNAGIAKKPLKLTYAFPASVTGLKHVIFKMNANDVKQLWRSVHNVHSTEFLAEEVDVFMRSVEAHFQHYISINLDHLSLSEVQNTSLLVNTVGKIKMFAEKTAPHILKHLVLLAIKRIPNVAKFAEENISLANDL